MYRRQSTTTFRSPITVPGYGSAARFVAQTTIEAGLDTETMRRTDPIKLIEVMGRHAGWLAAAAWLGRRGPDSAPHLVYLPERPRSEEIMLAEVEAVYRRLGYCVVVLCENQPDPSGAVFGAGGEALWTDSFGHSYYDSPAQHLARLLRQHLRVRTRVDKPGTIQRMSIAHQSSSDRREAELAGEFGGGAGAGRRSDLMVTLTREIGAALPSAVPPRRRWLKSRTCSVCCPTSSSPRTGTA